VVIALSLFNAKRLLTALSFDWFFKLFRTGKKNSFHREDCSKSLEELQEVN
jgi:hypothetical protein